MNIFPNRPVLFAALLTVVLQCNLLAQKRDNPDRLTSVQDFAPVPVDEKLFEILKIQSPFVRSLDPSGQFVLTGLAEIGGRQVATLYNTTTRQVQVIGGPANSSGWQLVGITGDPKDLETVTVQISADGGEVVYARYDEAQLQKRAEASRPRVRIPADQVDQVAEQARNFKRGISGDGYRGPPPPELVSKLSKLNEKTRGELIYRIGQMRREGVGSEERQKAFSQMVDQALKRGR